jgi:murein DD-endopeptidase MepM/ murein hydrolase activator NlpD
MIRTAMAKLLIALVVLLVLIALPIGALLAVSSHSTLTFPHRPEVISQDTPVVVHIVNPHGVRHVVATLEQNGVSTTLLETTNPATRFTFWRKAKAPEQVAFSAGKKKAPNLQDGKARLTVEAESNDLRATTDTISTEVQVNLHPLAVTADSFQHYINQGGSEMVLLTPSGYWTEAGVRAGPNKFDSLPAPSSGGQRLVLFAFPWDLPVSTAPVVFAGNPAGAEATAHFWFKIFPKKFRARDLVIDDKFLDKVVNQIEPNGKGDLLSRFLKINGQLRVENNRTLADLRLKSEPKFLWTQPFVQLANSKVESEFADVRSYIYNGKKVDRQVHLGFDLAVTAHTPVVAANDGRVVWAAPLGIYGNCIVVDHGYTLQSIYGHLSEIDVKEGEMVKRNQVMGKSGSTGLAGGDHLHFSMQVGGVQVNPVEWWDEHWIKDHIRDRLK